MKCAFCGTGMQKEMVEHKVFGVSLGKFPAMACPKCGEKFYAKAAVDAIQAASRRMGLFGLACKVKAAKIGNSIAVRVPKKIAESVHLKPGIEIILHPEGNKIVAEIA